MTLTDQKVSQFGKNASGSHENYDFRCWFLYITKELLYERLDRRCEEMAAKGFIEEVKRLKKAGLEENTSASQAIGYRQCLEYLATPQTKSDHDHFMDAFKRATSRLSQKTVHLV